MCGLIECVSRVCCVFVCSVCAVCLHCTRIRSPLLCAKSHYITAVPCHHFSDVELPAYVYFYQLPARKIAITEFICKRNFMAFTVTTPLPPTPAGHLDKGLGYPRVNLISRLQETSE